MSGYAEKKTSECRDRCKEERVDSLTLVVLPR